MGPDRLGRGVLPARRMSYRDWLVGQAVAGLGAHAETREHHEIARAAVGIADAVLAELHATDPPDPAGPDPFAGGAVRVLEDDGEPS
jgi:hypothetical protein